MPLLRRTGLKSLPLQVIFFSFLLKLLTHKSDKTVMPVVTQRKENNYSSKSGHCLLGVKKQLAVGKTALSGMARREREGGWGGRGVTRDELENELAGRSALNQRHRCADLPSS